VGGELTIQTCTLIQYVMQTHPFGKKKKILLPFSSGSLSSHLLSKTLKIKTEKKIITLLFYITNYMEQSLSSEANSHLPSQEIPSLLWNLKVHYHVHKSLKV